MSNIHYKGSAIAQHYSTKRIAWDHLFLSEKRALEQIKPNAETSVLDIGCATAGLYGILKERYGITHYTGVEINQEAAQFAKKTYMNIEMYHGDFLEITKANLQDRKFDLVLSLSTFDWNVEFNEMILEAWKKVKNDGFLCMNVRLVNSKSMFSITESFQFVNFNGQRNGEIAPYIIFNVRDFMKIVKELDANSIYINGYWGTPNSSTATAVSKVCFATVVLGKSERLASRKVLLELPRDLEII